MNIDSVSTPIAFVAFTAGVSYVAFKALQSLQPTQESILSQSDDNGSSMRTGNNNTQLKKIVITDSDKQRSRLDTIMFTHRVNKECDKNHVNPEVDQIVQADTLPSNLLRETASYLPPKSATYKTDVIPGSRGFDTYSLGSPGKENAMVDHLMTTLQNNLDEAKVVEFGNGFGLLRKDILSHNPKANLVSISQNWESLLYSASILTEEDRSRLSLCYSPSLLCDSKEHELFEEANFDVAVANRVTHFQSPEELDNLLDNITKGLVPGGLVYIAQLSPFNQSYSEKFLPKGGKTVEQQYRLNQQNGQAWPGAELIQFRRALTEQSYALPINHYVHLVDPIEFERQLTKRGFEILENGHYPASFYDANRKNGLDVTFVVARKVKSDDAEKASIKKKDLFPAQVY